MNSTNSSASTPKIYLIIAMAIIAIILAVLSSSHGVRSYLSQVYEHSKSRTILAKIFTIYNSNQYVIFKIRTESGIDIEIYEKDPKTFSEKLKQRFSFPDDKDAFLMVNGNSVSLALSDVDKNDVMDIVAPTVDQFGLSRLNVFKYDQDLNQFTQSVATE